MNSNTKSIKIVPFKSYCYVSYFAEIELEFRRIMDLVS
jgi:hypothetical protein